MNHEVLAVNGMSCGHCVKAIEGALGGLDGVIKAEANLQTNQVTVDYDENKVDLQKIKEVIEEEGYDVA